MSIAPISSISTKNNYIGFTGSKSNKKGKNSLNQKTESSQRGNSVSLLKAAPLAALLAMSPMVVSNAYASERYNKANDIELIASQGVNNIEQENKGKIIESKTFGKLKVNVRSNDGKTITGMEFEGKDSRGNTRYTPIEQYVTYNMNLCSDDGTVAKTYKLQEIRMADNGSGFGRQYCRIADVVNYVKSKLGPDNDAVEKIAVNKKFRYRYDTSIDNVVKGNLLKDAAPYDTKGAHLFGGQDFETSKGKYRVSFYSTDADDNNIELVTIEKKGPNGFPPQKLFSVINLHDVFWKEPDTEAVYMNNGMISLCGNNSKIQYTYFDEELFDTLSDFYNNDLANKPFIKLESNTNHLDTLENGIIYNVVGGKLPDGPGL